MTYVYRAYGVTLSSDVCLPGLRPITEPIPADVVEFSTGPKPEWVLEASRLPSRVIHVVPSESECADPTFVLSEFGNRQYFQLSYTDGTQFFLDAEARNVWGICPPPLTIEDMSTYFLGPGMGFILRRRNVTPLHASSVKLEGKTVLFCGEHAAGKSTTAGALALRGAKVICEDIAAIRENEGHFFVAPGYPRVCLWPDSVEKLMGSENALPALTPTWEKRFLDLSSRNLFETEPQALDVVYLLGSRETGEFLPRIEEISPKDALLDLVQNTYMNRLLSREERAAEFQFLSRVVAAVPCRKVRPHTDPGRIGALCDAISNDAAKLSVPQTAMAPR